MEEDNVRRRETSVRFASASAVSFSSFHRHHREHMMEDNDFFSLFSPS